MEHPLNFQEVLPILTELPSDIRREFFEIFSAQMWGEMKKLIHVDPKDVQNFLKISSGTLPKIKLQGTKLGKRVKPTLHDLEVFVTSHKATFPALADQENVELKKFVKKRIKQMKFMELD